MTEYLIPANEAHTQIDVKKSVFIAYAQHTMSISDAKAYIQSLKERYPDARHHCYGYITGSPQDSNQYGFSDDNEPSGTAGMPIFNHLKHSGLGQITVVIVRYFGGTKLGTGGLARAYGDATKAVLDILERKPYIEMKKVQLTFPFSEESGVRKEIERIGGAIESLEYGENVQLKAQIPEGVTMNLPYCVSLTSESTI